MEEYENEFELMDYLNVIWKRKWLIIIPTFILVLFVGIYSFTLPKIWEIEALIVPSKYFLQTENGQFSEILVTDPKQIAAQINQKTYDRLIASKMKLDIEEFPKIEAENLLDTNLVKVSLRSQDRTKAKQILLALFDQLKTELDDKVKIEFKQIDSQIKSNEIEKLRLYEEIKTLKNKLNIIKKRESEIEKEIDETRKRMESLENEQRLSLKKENRNETESLALLLYSNEIQLSLRYHNSLNELLNSKKIEKENIILGIENQGKKINQIENENETLNEKKARIDYAELIKEPTSSLGPVAPKKKQMVIIAGMLGLFIFTMLAFFLEYIAKQKIRVKD